MYSRKANDVCVGVRLHEREGLRSLLREPGEYSSENLQQPQQTAGGSAAHYMLHMASFMHVWNARHTITVVFSCYRSNVYF